MQVNQFYEEQSSIRALYTTHNQEGVTTLPHHTNSSDKLQASGEPTKAHSILVVSPQVGNHWHAQQSMKDHRLWITFSFIKDNIRFHLSRSSANSRYDHSTSKCRSGVDYNPSFLPDMKMTQAEAFK